MRTYLLYGAALLAAAGAVALVLMPAFSVIVGDWSRRDVELRSKLIFNSIRDQVAQHLATADDAPLAAFLERLTDDEKLLGLGYCNSSGHLRAATKLMPASITCDKLARSETPSYSTTESGGRSTFVATFPIAVKDTSGHVAILHDLSFVEARASEARNYWALALIGIGIGLAALAGLFVSNLLKRWRNAVRETIREMRSGTVAELSVEAIAVLGPEVRNLLREIRPGARPSAAVHVDWSPKVLQALLDEELPDTQVIVVSNREPYIHNHVGDDVVLQVPASGLVAALEPVMRACGGTWIAHGSGSADRLTVDRHDRIAVPPASPAYSLRRLWLSEEEQNGYYYGLANEGLWPLCHISFVRPSFREFGLARLQGRKRALRRRHRRGGAGRRPDHPRPGLSLRLAAADAAAAPAARHHPDLLAHPVAERGDVQHLPLEGGDYRRAVGQRRPRVPHAVSLQQPPRDGRSVY